MLGAKLTASRAAASTFTNQTLAQMDLQEELLAAQAEIELLWAQLAARTPRDTLLSNIGLVAVFKTLA